MIWLVVTGLLGSAQKAGLFTTLGLFLFYTSGRFPQVRGFLPDTIEPVLGADSCRDSSAPLPFSWPS